MLTMMVNDMSAKEDDAQNRDKTRGGFISEITPELLLNMVFVKA